MRLLLRAMLRELSQHPLLNALAIFGIALGVAAVLAVQIASISARASFERSTQALSGHTNYVIEGGPAGVPEAFYRTLRIELGIRDSAPVVSGWVQLETDGRWCELIGLDPIAELGFGRLRVASEASRSFSPADNGVWVSTQLAHSLPHAADGTLTLRAAERSHRLPLAGVIDIPGSRLFADIASAQVILGRGGWLSRIELQLDDRQAQHLRTQLPADLTLRSQRERNEQVTQLSSAFDFNLTSLSLLVLLIGAFLIFSTMQFVVTRRRTLYRRLYALGVTRGELAGLIAVEAAILGSLGTLLGGVIGLWLGHGVLPLFVRTVDDLYYPLATATLTLTPVTLLKVTLLGLGATLLAACWPGREALRELHSRAPEHQARADQRRVRPLLLALAGIGAALVIIAGSRGLPAGFLALALLVTAAVLVMPDALRCLTRRLHPLPLLRRSLLWRLALRDIDRHRQRTAIAVVALAVALGSALAMAVMIDSFRSGVEHWLHQLLQADIYVQPQAAVGNHQAVPLAPGVVERLQASLGVAAVATYQRVETRSGQRSVQLIALDAPPQARAGYQLISGETAAAWAAFDHGAALISEPLAWHAQLGVGDQLTLASDHGPLRLRVAGIFRDYGSEHGRVLLARPYFARAFAEDRPGSAGLFLTAGTPTGEVLGPLAAQLSPLQALDFRSAAEILTASLAVFDRTFSITALVRVIALTVAVAGVLGSLLALAIERRREFAILRVLGLMPGELLRLLLLECGWLGLAAGLLALPLGLGMAYMLTAVINRRAFGWSLPFEISAETLLSTLLLAVLAALLAGIYPALQLARTPAARTLHEE